MGRHWVFLGAVLAGGAVAAGALGAHGLEQVLSSKDLETYKVAVQYQMYHAFALMLTGLLVERCSATATKIAGSLFILGILLFSGCLYLWLSTQIKTFALIVPVGGVSWIIAWFVLAFGALRGRSAQA